MDKRLPYTETSDNIETDAHIDVDENEVESSSQSSSCSESTLRPQSYYKQSSNSSSSKLDTSTLPGSLVYVQSARPITYSDDREHLRYLSHMPSELQEDNFEILIINSENDMKAAKQFKSHLSKDILFSIHNQLRTPRVKLLHEIMSEAINNLDLAFPKALYVFFYVTKHFCEQQDTLLKGQACLTEAIEDPKRKWCVVPVHTASKKTQRYRLPMMLNCLRAINYWSGSQDQFYVDGVRKLLESKAGVLLERERLLDEARKDYFLKKRSEILQRVQYLSGTKSLACNISSERCFSKAHEDSSKVSLPDSSNNASSVLCTKIYTQTSLLDEQNNSLPDVSLSDFVERIDKIKVCEENSHPQNNSSERIYQNVLQQPESSYVHNRRHGAECSQHERTARATNSNINNNFESIRQNSPTVPISSLKEQDSIVVDGPAVEDILSSSTNPGFSGYPHWMTHATPTTSSVHISSYTPANTTQSTLNGVPTTFQHSYMEPPAYNTTIQGIHVPNSSDRPMFIPMLNYQGMQSQYIHPSYAYGPNLYQSMHQLPQMFPYNMQQLYPYANPFPQNTLFHNAMRSQSQTSEPVSDIRSSQMSTEVSAPNSLRPSLSDGSLNASAFGSFPGMNSQWIHPEFTAWNNTPFSHLINQHPAVAPLSRPEGQTFPTVPQQTRSHNQFSDEQKTLHEHQLGTGRTASGSNTHPLASSAEIAPEATTGTVNPVIQHIHHHHHEKKVTVENATNVLIGDKSTFMNRIKSSELAATYDESSEDDSGTPNDENSISDPTRLSEPSSSTSRSNRYAAAEPKINISDTPGNGHTINPQNNEASFGFAECLSPVSTRQPVEGSDKTSFSVVDDGENQTDCKQLC